MGGKDRGVAFDLFRDLGYRKYQNRFVLQIGDKTVVSHREIYPIVRGVWNLSSLHIQSALATNPTSNVMVKGDKGIIESITVIEMLVSFMVKNYPALTSIHDEMKSWINLLDREYGDPNSISFMKHIHLKIDHAKKLKGDTSKWFSAIYGIYQKSNTKLINEDELYEQAISLKTKLDEKEYADLRDSVECLVNNIPTPAAMMLYRVGESRVQKFYAKEMKKKPPEGTTMGAMAHELRKKQADEISKKIRTKADPLVNYILVQTDERNLAQHPERRFTQTEAEEVFIFLKKLINDVDDRLKN